jgi:hypothetical protein
MKGDVCAAFFVKALHLISAYLGRVINVMLVPRCFTWESNLADSLSRTRTNGFLESQVLKRFIDIAKDPV